jgi:hypothetical protein
MKHLPYIKRIQIRLKEIEKAKNDATLNLNKILDEQKELEISLKIFEKYNVDCNDPELSSCFWELKLKETL